MTHPVRGRTLAVLLLSLVIVALVAIGAFLPVGRWWPHPTEPPQSTSLRDAAGGRPLVGSAVAGDAESSALTDSAYRQVLATEFDLLTPENQMKWAAIHPERDRYDFAGADEVARFARENGQHLRGHALVWYGALPPWAKELGGRPCSEVRPVLRDHIRTVVGRYRGVVAEWDVANEVVDEQGRLRTDIDPVLRACGEPILVDAFRWAHEADPEAILYINDFDIERPGPKSDALEALIRRLKAKGAPVNGVGFQAHLRTDDPDLAAFPAQLRRFADLGLHVAVTEADVTVNMRSGAPAGGEAEKQANMFGALMRACRGEKACRSFTFWGFADTHSWTGSPTWGRGAGTPLDSKLRNKPAIDALTRTLTQNRPPR